MSDKQHTQNWPELAEALYDKLTARGAEITYEFEHMSVSVPSGTSDSAQHAQWRLDGILKIRARDNATGTSV